MDNRSMKNKPQEYWRDKLTPEQYKVLQEKGTEAPFSGKLLAENHGGVFVCGGCGTELFKSETKYASALPGLLGWPSFSDAISSDTIELINDTSHGMERVEVVCATCGGHLGHIFDDHTSPTGKHYCINSVSLDFKPKST